MHMQNPNKLVAIIWGLLLMIVFAGYIILLNHAKVYGQEQHPNADEHNRIMDEIIELRDSDDMFAGLTPDELSVEVELIRREMDDVQRAMKKSVMQHLFHCFRYLDNKGVLQKSCRNDPHGCENRIEALTTIVVDSTYKHGMQKYGLDAWWIGAIITYESTWDPFKISSRGAVGIMQLMPTIPLTRGSKFVRSPRYRKKCKSVLGNCQEEVIELGLRHLKNDFESCDGSLEQALTKYNSGRCLVEYPKGSGRFQPRRGYIRRIKSYRKSLMRGYRPVKRCDNPRIKRNVLWDEEEGSS